MKYRLYVDEVGNPDLKSSENEEHRFLCLTGVAFKIEYVSKILFPELEKIKKDFFNSHPDDPIIFHRKEDTRLKRSYRKIMDGGTHNLSEEDLEQHFYFQRGKSETKISKRFRSSDSRSNCSSG